MDKIIANYDRLFQGIGKITDKKNNREIYGQFHMKPEAIPVTQKPRPVHTTYKATEGMVATRSGRGHI
jgi:hypothetical protein